MARHAYARGQRRGKVIVMLALSLTAVVGYVALAADGGLLVEHRRQVQNASDMGAMAAAIDLYTNWRTNAGLDSSGSAAARAKEAVAAQGFVDGVSGVSVVVNIPPLSGPHTGEAGYAEVIVDYPQPRYFAGIFGSAPTHLRARAVARGRLTTGHNGILVLDLSVSESLKANGTGTVTVNNADIIVNSNDPQAVGGDGTGAILKDVGGAFQLTGGVKANATLVGTINYNQPPTPDPLAYLPEPPLPANAQTAKGVKPNSGSVATYLSALNLDPKSISGSVYVLDPGRYDKLPNFTNGDVVILRQASANSQEGVYYLNGSGFTSNGATVVMDPTGGTTGGVMLYDDTRPNGNSTGISLTGGQVRLAPPTSGTYQGLSIFQERSSTVDLSITGQGGTQMTGTFYAAGAAIKVTGSDSTNADVIGSQYISRTLQIGGNGTFSVNWDPKQVAPMRQLAIVE
jgi:hypothetical protein